LAIGVLLAVGALAGSAQAGAAVYKGKGKDDPKVKIRLVADRQNLTFFKPRNFKLRFDDKDRTSVRARPGEKVNTSKLPLELRPNGRRRFSQDFQGTGENGGKVKVDIVGSLNPSRTRARGWFRIRVVLGTGEDLPKGTVGTSGRVRWLVKRR